MQNEISLMTSECKTEKVEIMFTFRIEQFKKDYVIYKNIDETNTHYYAASFTECNGITNLDTDLTDEEKKILNEMFKKYQSGEIK